MNRKQRLAARIGGVAAAAMCLFPPWMVETASSATIRFAFWLAPPHPHATVLFPQLLLQCVLLTGALLSGVSLLADRERWQGDTRLREHYDLTQIGWLISELKFGNRHTRPTTKRALARLLPYLQPEHARYLDPHHHRFLCYLLRTLDLQRETDFLVNLLHALEKIGTAQAVGPVWELAEAPARTRNEMRVRAAAQQCLPHLRQQAEREEIRQTLLRPAASPEMSETHLLRAVVYTPDADPQQLLRVASGSR